MTSDDIIEQTGRALDSDALLGWGNWNPERGTVRNFYGFAARGFSDREFNDLVSKARATEEYREVCVRDSHVRAGNAGWEEKLIDADRAFGVKAREMLDEAVEALRANRRSVRADAGFIDEPKELLAPPAEEGNDDDQS